MIRSFPLSLLNFSEMSDGVSSGVADIVTILTPYFPNLYPNTNMVADLSMAVVLNDKLTSRDHTLIYAAAMAEYILLHCDDCRDEYASKNQVFTSSVVTAPYVLMCTKPVTSLSEFKGKKMRVGSASWARWVNSVGGTAVTMSGGDSYEALSQGVVDCDVQAPAQLSALKLSDITKYITTNIPGGLFAGGGSSNINIKKWRSLSKENRATILKAAAKLSAAQAFEAVKYSQRDLDKALADGIEFVKADNELLSITQSFIEEDLKTIVKDYEDRYKLKDAPKKYSEFMSTLDKWSSIVPGLKDQEELEELLWNEIYSNVDLESYGM